MRFHATNHTPHRGLRNSATAMRFLAKHMLEQKCAFFLARLVVQWGRADGNFFDPARFPNYCNKPGSLEPCDVKNRWVPRRAMLGTRY